MAKTKPIWTLLPHQWAEEKKKEVRFNFLSPTKNLYWAWYSVSEELQGKRSHYSFGVSQSDIAKARKEVTDEYWKAVYQAKMAGLDVDNRIYRYKSRNEIDALAIVEGWDKLPNPYFEDKTVWKKRKPRKAPPADKDVEDKFREEFSHEDYPVQC